MTEVAKPAVRPARPFFSSGPCAKRPGWTPEALKDALVGRSHRSKPGKAKLKDAIDRTRKILGIPADYAIGIVPASDTGAVEMAMWSLLGPLRDRHLRLGKFWRGLGHRHGQAAQAEGRRAQGRLTASCRTLKAGQGPRCRVPVERHHLGRAGARMATGSPPTAKASPSATPPAPPLPWTCPGTSSMPPLSPGRKCWAAKRRTACWCCRPAPWRGWKATRRLGRCRKSSA